jgi:Zn-dependent protease with chaperone function
VTKARTVFAVLAALAALATAVVFLALRGLVADVSLTVPSVRELARACTRFALPDASLISLASLPLGSIAVAVLLLAIRSGARQLRASRRFLNALGPLAQDSHHAVHIFEARAPAAFCAGLMRPRVYVSSGAVRQLSGEELHAILAHEAHHARLRDPLRLLFARVFGDALFFLPGVRQLGDRYSALAEVAADEAAVRAAGDRAPLASALLTFESADPAVVGIAPERVEHLLGDTTRWQLPGILLAWTLVLLTVVGALAARLDRMGASSELSLPLVAAQTCMLLMALAPLMLGGGALLGVGRLLGGRRGA